MRRAAVQVRYVGDRERLCPSSPPSARSAIAGPGLAALPAADGSQRSSSARVQVAASLSTLAAQGGPDLEEVARLGDVVQPQHLATAIEPVGDGRQRARRAARAEARSSSARR